MDKGLQRDDSLPVDISYQWTSFLREQPLIFKIQIPRHDTYNAQNVHIHGFCDASKAVYCVLVILGVQNDDNFITSHLLMTKSRVTPLKQCHLDQ